VIALGLALWLGLAGASPALSDAPEVWVPYGGPVVVDGELPAWEWIDAVHLTFEGGEGPVDVFLKQTGEDLLLGFHIPDSSVDTGDQAIVFLDPLHDAAAAPQPDDRMYIQTRSDSRIKQVGNGTGWEWTSEGDWEAAYVSDTAGWTAELRIGYSELELTAGDAGRVLGLDLSSLDNGTYYRWTFEVGDNWMRPELWGDARSRDAWGEPGTPTPGPQPTATPLPTATAGPSPTATEPQELPGPPILAAGWMQTRLSGEFGGAVELLAWAGSGPAGPAVEVELWFAGAPTGVFLEPVDPEIGLFALPSLVAPPGLPAGPLAFALVARDAAGNPGAAWPSLEVPERRAAPVTLERVAPSSSLLCGGADCLIVGTGFQEGIEVTIGGLAVPVMRRLSATRLLVTTPESETTGPSDLQVRNPDGGEAELPEAVHYVGELPVITGVDPPSAPREGGIRIMVSGAGFQPGVRLYAGADPLTGVVRHAEDLASGLLPAGPSGPTRIRAVNPDGGESRIGGLLRRNEGGGSGRFVDATAGALPERLENSGNCDFADLDGDGDLDIVVAGDGVQTRLLENDGSGVFRDVTAERMPSGAWHVDDAEAGDVDGDGDLDLFLADYEARDRLLINDGSGAFSDESGQRLPALEEPSWDADFADLDEDGDLDLIIAVAGGPNRLLRNDGQGTFTLDSGFPVDDWDSRDVDAADLDGDGDLDLVVANFEQPCRLLRNAGGGRFVVEEAALPDVAAQGYEIDPGDVDGDGDLDLVVAMGGATGRNRIWINDGAGRFREESDQRLPAVVDGSSDVELADVDGDGDLDLAVANFFGGNRLYLNDGAGNFADASDRLPPLGESAVDLDFGDVDGDGDLDIYIANHVEGQDRLLLNESDAAVGAVIPDHGPVAGGLVVRVTGFALAGVQSARVGSNPATIVERPDEDTLRLLLPPGNAGAAELVLELADGVKRLPKAVRLGAGRVSGCGGFRLAEDGLPAESLKTQDGGVGDVDGDGDLDLLVPGYAIHPNRLYLNAGNGRFEAAPEDRLPAVGGHCVNIELGDLDGDGDLDAVVARDGQIEGEPNLLWLNDGSGRFTDATAERLPAAAGFSEDVDLIDIDLDGDLDLAFANLGAGEQNRIYINDGAGVLQDATSQWLPADLQPSYDVEFGDLNGDGRPDLVVGNYGTANQVFLQTAESRLVLLADALPAGQENTTDLDLGDVDGDGDLDLVVANFSQANQVWLNQGDGRFVAAEDSGLEDAAELSQDIDLADLDGDGDLDLVVANLGETRNRLYLGDGRGHFRDVTELLLPDVARTSYDVDIADFDEDGRLDLFFSNSAGDGQQNSLYLGGS
jgi:hypothetical protein